MVSSVGCVRFGEGTLVTSVLQVAAFDFMSMLDIHTFLLRANRALATYRSQPTDQDRTVLLDVPPDVLPGKGPRCSRKQDLTVAIKSQR